MGREAGVGGLAWENMLSILDTCWKQGVSNLLIFAGYILE